MSKASPSARAARVDLAAALSRLTESLRSCQHVLARDIAVTRGRGQLHLSADLERLRAVVTDSLQKAEVVEHEVQPGRSRP